MLHEKMGFIGVALVLLPLTIMVLAVTTFKFRVKYKDKITNFDVQTSDVRLEINDTIDALKPHVCEAARWGKDDPNMITRFHFYGTNTMIPNISPPDQFIAVLDERYEDAWNNLAKVDYVSYDDYIQQRSPAPNSSPLVGGTRTDRVQLLVNKFGSTLQQAQQYTKQGFDKRLCPISPEAGRVVGIGHYFPLTELDKPARQLLRALRKMNSCFLTANKLPKFKSTLQALRLVAAPGLGKSTALTALWHAVASLVQAGELSQGDEHDQRLRSRILASLRDRMLVFKLDLSQDGLNKLYPIEKELCMDAVLALRMLYSVVCMAKPSESYQNFLDDLQDVLDPCKLQPTDVLHFIRQASGLDADADSLVVFAFDEVNAAVQSTVSPGTPWVQDMLSQFINMRMKVAMGQQPESACQPPLKMMPLLITASTFAAATSLRSTGSGESKWLDLQLQPLSLRSMQTVVLNIYQRLSVTKPPMSRLQQHVLDVLQLVEGNPRLLAWAMSAMSGCNVVDEEVLRIGKNSACPWMTNANTFDITKLVDSVVGHMLHKWKPWLSGDKAEVMAEVVAHAVLGLRVARSDAILGNGRSPATWQDLEVCGICYLVHQLRTGSGSNPGSISGAASDSASAEVSEEEAEQTGTASPDTVRDLLVFLPPAVFVAAQRWMQVDGAGMTPVPLLQSMVDEWRQRELTDVSMLVLKLQLLHKVRNKSEVSLAEVVPGAEQHPIQVPQDRFWVVPVHEQLNKQGWKKLVDDAMAGGNWAFIGPGNQGPDSWLILKRTDDKPLVLYVQSKKRTNDQLVGRSAVQEEAGKCNRDEGSQHMMVFVTDQRPRGEHAGLLKMDNMDVLVFGPDSHSAFYTPSAAFLKRAIKHLKRKAPS